MGNDQVTDAGRHANLAIVTQAAFLKNKENRG
jgi:hypothetical protein